MKVVKAYAPTSGHDDQLVERLYENVESEITKVNMQYTVLTGDFNAKVGKKQAGDPAVGEYSIGSTNNRGEFLVEFAERNNLRITNTFFRKHENRKWTWRSPNGETKMIYTTYFALSRASCRMWRCSAKCDVVTIEC